MLVACNDAADSSANVASTAGSGNQTGDAGVDAGDLEPVPDSLAFTPSSTVTLSPKETRDLTVSASPAGIFHVSFALIASGDSPGDASLDTNEADTDETGQAHVSLTAPSMPITFSVRASVGTKVQTLLGVAVGPSHFTTLHVIPSYAGHRSISSWTATARADITCDQLMGNPPPDGNLIVTSMSAASLDLSRVPVGHSLAVTVRAGHYIGGCATQSALSEGDGNQVLVFVTDRPLNLEATELNLSFGQTAPAASFSSLMKSAATLAESTLLGESQNDVQALLVAMHDATSASSDRNAFAAARISNGWDQALSAAFGSGAATRLRGPAERWLNAGLATFDSADTFLGTIGMGADGPAISLTSIAHLSPADAGLPSTFAATWSADSSDTVLLGTQLTWVPSRLVTALAAAPALADFPAATSTGAALAESVDCTLVASTLLAHGTTPGSLVYAGCNSACALTACTSAVTSLWQNATAASATTGATLDVTATGSATVGDEAEATALISGSWVGKLQVGNESAPAAGPLTTPQK